MIKKGGCCFYVLMGLAGLFVLTLLAGVGLYFYIDSHGGLENFAKKSGAKTAVWVIDGELRKLPLSDPEVDSAISPLVEWVDETDPSKLSMEKAKAVGEGIARSPAGAVLGLLLFEKKYIMDSDDFTEDEKADAHLTVNRISRGLISGKISIEQLSGIFAIVLVKKKNKAVPGELMKKVMSGEGGLEDDFFKKSLTRDDVGSCLATMKNVSDHAGISKKIELIDLGPLVKDSIDKASE